MPETDDEWDWHLDASAASAAYPTSLHELLRRLAVGLLSLCIRLSLFRSKAHTCIPWHVQSDRSGRDALRTVTATTVSPAVAQLALVISQLSIRVDQSLSSSAEQDERNAANLRESLLRLREAEDDHNQLNFELEQERSARSVDATRFSNQATTLEAQLRELTRTVEESLADTRREREHELQTALSAFEAQQSRSSEQRASIERAAERANEARVPRAGEERKRKVSIALEVRDAIARYDAECSALDEKIEAEKQELERIDAATRAIAHHFERIDEDRANQLSEQNMFDRAERARRLREMNLFRFVQRLQAVVRGFLARKRMRLELLAAKKRRRKRKGGAKGKGKTSKAVKTGKTVKSTGKTAKEPGKAATTLRKKPSGSPKRKT